MIDPEDLLGTARFLLGETEDRKPVQMRLRRAVSTAYYAIFHAIVQSASDLLVGARHRASPRYETVYRAFEHSGMKRSCLTIDKVPMGAKARKALGADKASRELRDVAGTFVTLQERRHWADYSSSGLITRAEARDLIDQAAFATAQLSSSGLQERGNFFAYLLLDIRD